MDDPMPVGGTPRADDTSDVDAPTAERPTDAGSPAPAADHDVDSPHAHIPAGGSHRYRRRVMVLPGGGRLELSTDGTLARLGADGTREQTWAPDDPEWPRLAIRFGLRVQSSTVTPPGRFVEGTKPPRAG